MIKSFHVLAAAATTLVAVGAAQAATRTTTFNVTANVLANCSVSANAELAITPAQLRSRARRRSAALRGPRTSR
jgi:hypothetical protein